VVPTVTPTGKPLAETVTEVPEGPVEGERVTIGSTMVKGTVGGEVVGSEICTLCKPAARFKVPEPPIMNHPERTPAAVVESCLVADRPLPVRVTLVERPSTEIVNALTVSLGPKPLPVT